MKRSVLTLVAALVLGLSMLGSVSAAGHTTEGTPGEPNCKGQEFAFLNEFGKTTGEWNGLGGFSRVNGLSVKETHAFIDAFCNT